MIALYILSGLKMNRPHIIINCAMSVDGKIAMPSKKQIRISSDEDIKRMYELRNSCDAVIIGIGSVLSDNPRLTVKEKYVLKPKNPIRVVLDSKCRTPVDYLVVDNKSKTIIATTEKSSNVYGNNVEIIQCKKDANGTVDLRELLYILYNKGIKKIMVEGGGTVIWNFLINSLVDDVFIYIAPIVIGGRPTPTMVEGKGIKNENNLIKLDLISYGKLGEGILFHYKIK